MKYYINDFSTYDFWTVRSATTNISNITDKLVRLTAKLTENYAGDIVYLINTLNECIEEGIPFDRIVVFREGGVSWYPVVNDGDVAFVETYGVPDCQVWRLKTVFVNCGITMTELRRVILKTDQAFPQYIGGST